jgi:hypothetical protein
VAHRSYTSLLLELSKSHVLSYTVAVDLETKPLGDKRRLWLHGSAAARCGDMVYFFGGSTAARFRKCLWTLDLSTLDFSPLIVLYHLFIY